MGFIMDFTVRPALMHDSARVVVTQDGLSIIVDKEAGVIQGSPRPPHC
jgi:hypothetical protein